ncbi:hypothetical protein PG996_009030 [Apiospora saccharicola]|uniref:Uncharacterized protein n=1 Tax=Apiospora saccharicola TaxID=335842 RepID=A0ABR1UJL0_9PEZI
MQDINNGRNPTKAHETSVHHEVSLHDVDEAEARPVRPLLHHQSSYLSYSYPESTFSSQSTEYGSSYGQEFVKGAEPRTEGTPKRVLQTGWLGSFQSWLFHAPAVLLTSSIVYIDSAKPFRFPEQGPRVGDTGVLPSTIINLLQVAAKVHEVIMVLSISSIILAIYRRRLIGNGIRLGFLTAGYRVGDIGYLFSSSFWRQGLDRTRPWEILLCGLFVFATAMSAIVGPASAVLLTPTLDWFDFAPGTAFNNIQSPLTYGVPRNYAWYPVMQANESSPEARACVTPVGLYHVGCPARGFREINQWVGEWRATNLASPILFQSVASDIGRRLKPLTDVKRSVVLSTTPSDFLLNSIGLFHNYIEAADVGAVSGNSGSGKPRYRLNTQGAAVKRNPFSAELLQPFVQSKYQIKWSALDELTSNFENMTNVPDHQVHDEGNSLEENDEKTMRETLLAMAIGTYLTEALARASPPGATLLKLASNDSTLQYALLGSQRQRAVFNITVHNTTHVYSDQTDMYTPGDLDSYEIAWFHGLLPIVLTAERYGYGTGQPRKTLHFAQIMLAMYLAAVFLYAAAITAAYILELCRNSTQSRHRILHVAAWSDLQDLLLLAPKTPAPAAGDLADAGAGVTSSGVWRKVVQVRADDRDHVQLVMDYEAQERTKPLGVTGKERYY